MQTTLVRAGMLVILLALPVLVFLGLRFFGTNHYRLPYYLPATDADGRVQLNGEDTLFRQLDRTYYAGVAMSDTPSDRMYLVHVLDSTCAESCERVLAQAARIQALATSIEGLKVVTLIRRGITFGNTPTWEIKTLNDAELAQSILAIGFNEKQLGGQTIPLESKFLLIDRAGYLRGYYNALLPEDIDRAMAEIKVLDHEYKQ